VEEYRTILAKWAEMLASGKADRFKEQQILHDFLTDVFCGVLGYTRPADDPDRHTISREKHVQVDGKYADAVLGDFREGKEQFKHTRRRRRHKSADAGRDSRTQYPGRGS
jgi:hypothetical protein